MGWDLESIKMVSVCSFLSIGREEGLTEPIGVPALQVSFFHTDIHQALLWFLVPVSLPLFKSISMSGLPSRLSCPVQSVVLLSEAKANPQKIRKWIRIFFFLVTCALVS